MVPKTLSDCSPVLLNAAREVCLKEGINFDTLDLRQARGLLYFWCLKCRRTYPLTDLIISKRKKVCAHCNDAVKLRGASNKFGSLRRTIFFRRLSKSRRLVDSSSRDQHLGSRRQEHQAAFKY